MIDQDLLRHEVVRLIENPLEQDETFFEERVLGSLSTLMASIPQSKKASYGIVSLIALLAKTLYHSMPDEEEVMGTGLFLYRQGRDFRVIVLGLGLLSHLGVARPQEILPILEEGANHEQWEVKEFVQMFIRKITKAHPDLVQEFLLDLTASDNPNHRRFASESLRPVVENKWIMDQPDYALKVLRRLFREKEDFPKVSVGNNLSDLSRKNPHLILKVVEELKGLQNEHSDFIAHRACRNLIKDHRNEVLDLLGIETYKYKTKEYSRS